MLLSSFLILGVTNKTQVKEKLTFPKEEKLKSRKIIGEIFNNGFAVKSYPIRIHCAVRSAAAGGFDRLGFQTCIGYSSD